MWSTANARMLVKELGAMVVEVDRDCFDFANMKFFGLRSGRMGWLEAGIT